MIVMAAGRYNLNLCSRRSVGNLCVDVARVRVPREDTENA
jgi:hypothetical protein